MRTRNALTRLAAVAPAEPPVDSVEEDRILERILASPRNGHRRRFARPVLALVALAVAAAVVAVLSTRGATKAIAQHDHVALTGARIQMAGYHFRTPAGFTASTGSCVAPSSSGPMTVMNGFAAAASAEGGCIEAFFLIADPGASTPANEGAEPVSVGNYQAYYVPADSSGESTLYVQLPTFANGTRQFLMLSSEGLTEDQLIAIAQSGLPDTPTTPGSVTG